jgi:hypothetical protein
MPSSKGTTDYSEANKISLNSIPLFRILRIENMQQYSKDLIQRGYGFDLTKFNNMT